MALAFTGGDTDKVNVGSGTSLNDLTTQTHLAWVQTTDIAPSANRWLSQKGTEPGQRIWTFAGLGGANQMTFELHRATDNLLVSCLLSNFAVEAADKWLFCAACIDTAGADGDQILLMGDLATPVAEPSAYANQAVGSGASTTNAGADFFIGNHPSASNSFEGDIAFFAVWNRQLTLKEVIAQQWHPHVTSGCVGFWHLGFNGTGTQPDWSGNTNNGTVTGAVASDHVPIGPLFGFDPEWSGAFTAAPTFVPYPKPRGEFGGMVAMTGGVN